MSDRYFCESPITADRAVLSGPEAHHLLHVMRAAKGRRVTLFDGSGCQFSAVVERLGRSEVELAIVARQEVDCELPIELTLGVALPKGDRQKWLVEKAVELGVGRIVLLETQRGVAQPVEKALERLRRSVIEASKQCGRNRLMEIAEPKPWDRFVRGAAPTAARWLAHPCSPSPLSPCGRGVGGEEALDSGQSLHHQPIFLAIGPEGGFTDDEVALGVDCGWRPVDLGPRILRVETAAVFLAALVSSRFSS